MGGLESRTKKIFKRIGLVLAVPLTITMVHDLSKVYCFYEDNEVAEKFMDRANEDYERNEHFTAFDLYTAGKWHTELEQDAENNLKSTWILKYLI
jgi:hypothetical protein